MPPEIEEQNDYSPISFDLFSATVIQFNLMTNANPFEIKPHFSDQFFQKIICNEILKFWEVFINAFGKDIISKEFMSFTTLMFQEPSL